MQRSTSLSLAFPNDNELHVWSAVTVTPWDQCAWHRRHIQRIELGGSWVVISGVITPLIRVIIIVILLRTPLITTLNPIVTL